MSASAVPQWGAAQARARGLALLLAGAGFLAVSLAIYAPALRGPFVSDDYGYIVTHPYTQELSARSVLAVFDPLGPAKLYAANYAPIHLLLTALEKQIFAEDPLGYHLVNVAVHALDSVLLSALLLASGVPLVAALVGGLLFCVHPANVEAVAWASQLKTGGCLAFALGALLLLRRHPLGSTLLFVLALLTKASASFAVPTAAAFVWAWTAAEPAGARRRWAWVAAWAALFAVYSIPQVQAFSRLGGVEVAAYSDPWVHARTMAAVGVRYLVMAASSWGVSAYQEPEPSGWLDPWWLAAPVLGGLLLARLLVALRRRRLEAAWWVWAAAAFAPVSQLFPFLNPVADRYLYILLPGLLGGVLCALGDLSEPLRRRGGPALLAASLGLAGLFAWQAAQRAPLWCSDTLLLLDAARHYPAGGSASYLRARRAAQEGDVPTALAALRYAADHGIDDAGVLEGDPGLEPLRGDPGFRELVRELAGRFIERAQQRGYSTQPELRALAVAHLRRGELAEALDAFERALAAGGPLDDVVRGEIESVRELRRRGEAAKEDGHPAAGS